MPVDGAAAKVADAAMLGAACRRLIAARLATGASNMLGGVGFGAENAEADRASVCGRLGILQDASVKEMHLKAHLT